MRAKEFMITVGVDAYGETDVQVKPMHQHRQVAQYPEPEQSSCGCDDETDMDFEDDPEADDAQPVMISPQQQEIELQKAELGKKSVAAAQLVHDAEDDEIA